MLNSPDENYYGQEGKIGDMLAWKIQPKIFRGINFLPKSAEVELLSPVVNLK